MGLFTLLLISLGDLVATCNYLVVNQSLKKYSLKSSKVSFSSSSEVFFLSITFFNNCSSDSSSLLFLKYFRDSSAFWKPNRFELIFLTSLTMHVILSLKTIINLNRKFNILLQGHTKNFFLPSKILKNINFKASCKKFFNFSTKTNLNPCKGVILKELSDD